MNVYKSTSELKALAREQLRGKYGISIGVVLIAALISTIISIFATVIVKTDSMTSIIIYYLISFIITLLSAVLTLGLIKFFINFTRNKDYQIGDVFWGFQNHPDKVIVLTLILTLLILVCLLPGIIFLILYLVTKNILLFVMTVLTLMIGCIAVIILKLTYSQTVYLLADEKNNSVIESLKASQTMMKGNKGRLFYLHISFIGWYLLSVFSCGIAMLWIEPYRLCATTNFYLDLKEEFKENIVEEDYNMYHV